jgi:hypothetical protein
MSIVGITKPPIQSPPCRGYIMICNMTNYYRGKILIKRAFYIEKQAIIDGFVK